MGNSGAGTVAPCPEGDVTRVVVIENGGNIVSVICLLRVGSFGPTSVYSWP